MSFEDLPPLPPLLNPGAEEHAQRIMALTKLAMSHMHCILDIPYGEDYWQKIDLYLPPVALSGGSAKLPVLCFLHGGAWVNGCKEWMGFLAPSVASVPAIYVAVSYRFAPQVTMPLIVDDCVNALAWVERNIAGYGGDPSNLHVGGHSAGAHLAALLALREDLLREKGIPPDSVKSCVITSGSYNLKPRASEPEARVDLMKKVLGDLEKAWEWSPLKWIRKTNTSFVVSWAQNDFPLLREQGAEFFEALAKLGTPVRSFVTPNTDHFTVLEAFAHPQSEWQLEVARAIAQRTS